MRVRVTSGVDWTTGGSAIFSKNCQHLGSFSAISAPIVASKLDIYFATFLTQLICWDLQNHPAKNYKLATWLSDFINISDIWPTSLIFQKIFDEFSPWETVIKKNVWSGAQIVKCALCSTFSIFLQVPLRRCGLTVSSPVHCFSHWWRFQEALFVVSRLDSKGPNVRKSCRAWKFSNMNI